MLNQVQTLLIFVLLIGIFIGRKAPMTRNALRQWLYNRRHIPYFVCHLIENNSIISTATVQESQGSYEYKDNTYFLFDKEKESSHVPYLNIHGLQIVFHNKNNVNPLTFKERAVEPAYNDPQIFTSFIRNKDIGNVIHDRGGDLSVIKRYIVIAMIAIGAGMAALVYLFLNYA